MKTTRTLLLLALALTFAPAAWALPRIKVLATGGTIAGAQSTQADAGYKSGTFSVDDLIKAVPQLKNIAEMSGEQVANIGSQTMNHEVWLKLAARVNEVLKSDDVDGVVITHGTDTMEETAYFLSLVVKSGKPVVLVGSMRPATAISADGPINLYNAVALAGSPEAKDRGPLVVLNDTIHYAREAQKMHTTRMDTFASPNRGIAGMMNTGKAFFYSANTVRHTTKSEFSIDGLTVANLPRVEVVYSYANLGGDIIDTLVEKGVKGIVLAGVGDGNSTDAALAALEKGAKAGVAVVRCSRVGSGIVDRNVEVNDDKLGFIAGMELNAQKARILLMLSLTKTSEPKKLQEYSTSIDPRVPPLMDWTSHILKAAPETALFAALALGHALGRLKFGSFSLGGVAGSLIVALVIGQLTGVVIPDALKALCFALFIYAVGFKSGPEFFGGLNRSSLKLMLSSVVQCVTALIIVILIARTCGFGKGFAAGIGAGALTQTAMLGTAGDAVSRLGLSADETARLNGQMAVAFAMTYVFGTVGVIVFLRSIAPRWLGVDVKTAARELESELASGGAVSRPGYITPFVPVVARAFEVSAAAGRTVSDVAKQFDRASVERILRNEQVIEPGPKVVLQSGDVVGIAGRLEAVIAAGRLVGKEIESHEALSFAAKAATVVVTDKRVVGRTLDQVRSVLGKANLQGVYLSSFKRQGLALPILPGTEVRRGDVVELVGQPDQVDRVAAMIGSAEASGGKSDLAYHAVGIVAGTLLGLLSVTVGGIPVTLGIGGGVLVSGLCFGWMHVRYPVFGGLPSPAQWILSELGLSAFAAAVGLAAGPRAVAAIQEQGVALLLAGAVVTLVPLVVALGFGRFVLKLHPVVLLGAICGGQTVAAALNAVNEETDSSTPVLGFTVTYAISNVLLAIWGPVIVAFT